MKILRKDNGNILKGKNIIVRFVEMIGILAANIIHIISAQSVEQIAALEAAGIHQNTIRLSIGTEHIDDIIADLENGFAAV